MPGIVMLLGRYHETVHRVFKLNHPMIIMQESNSKARPLVIPGSSLRKARNDRG